MTVGERIKSIRVSKDISQEELARLMGYSGKSSISKLENSGDKIDLETIQKVADVLHCEVVDLLDKDFEDQKGRRIRVSKRVVVHRPDGQTYTRETKEFQDKKAIVSVEAMPKVGEARVTKVTPTGITVRKITKYSKREKIIKELFELSDESIDEIEKFISFIRSKSGTGNQ